MLTILGAVVEMVREFILEQPREGVAKAQNKHNYSVDSQAPLKWDIRELKIYRKSPLPTAEKGGVS